jgi:HSP20 family molecular chaperone IbpA
LFLNYCSLTADEFSYKIEADGKVLIKGVTITGERTVYKFSQKFEMLSRNLCPPGQFSISFQLPGPVDPRQLTSNFGDDGIFDALIMKSRETTQS